MAFKFKVEVEEIKGTTKGLTKLTSASGMVTITAEEKRLRIVSNYINLAVVVIDMPASALKDYEVTGASNEAIISADELNKFISNMKGEIEVTCDPDKGFLILYEPSSGRKFELRLFAEGQAESWNIAELEANEAEMEIKGKLDMDLGKAKQMFEDVVLCDIQNLVLNFSENGILALSQLGTETKRWSMKISDELSNKFGVVLLAEQTHNILKTMIGKRVLFKLGDNAVVIMSANEKGMTTKTYTTPMVDTDD